MMGVYADVADCTDAALAVEERHIDEADVYVTLSLKERGLSDADIAAITLPNATLKMIAVAWAKRSAAIEGALGENSPLIDKAKQFKETATTLVNKLTRESVGLETATGAGPAFFKIGRA